MKRASNQLSDPRAVNSIVFSHTEPFVPQKISSCRAAGTISPACGDTQPARLIPQPCRSRAQYRLRAVDYAHEMAAENLAAGPAVAGQVVALWLESPGHRHNLLLEDVTTIGVGYARAASPEDRFRHYWVLILAAGR